MLQVPAILTIHNRMNSYKKNYSTLWHEMWIKRRGKPNVPAWQNQQQQDGGGGGGGVAVAVAAADVVKHLSILFMEHHSTQAHTVWL